VRTYGREELLLGGKNDLTGGEGEKEELQPLGNMKQTFKEFRNSLFHRSKEKKYVIKLFSHSPLGYAHQENSYRTTWQKISGWKREWISDQNSSMWITDMKKTDH